jgi:hypothetical protein
MAFYLVRARPRKEILENLQQELNSGKISRVRPFGLALQYSLENASSTLEDGAIENIDLAKLSM